MHEQRWVGVPARLLLARAILFSVHNSPLLKAVDKYRIQPLSERQTVVGEFQAEQP